MPCRARWTYLFVCILGVFSLSACGGGGGGGSSSTPPSSGNPSTPPPASGPQAPVGSFDISTASLAFESEDEVTPPEPQTVTFNVSDVESSEVLFQAALVTPGSGLLAQLAADGSGVLTVAAIPSLVDPGVHSAAIQVSACAPKPVCTRQLEGSPKTINVTYTKKGLGSTPPVLEFELRNGASEVSRTVPMTVLGYPEQTWTVTTNEPWLKVSRASGSTADATPVNVIIDESGGLLKNGRHNATVNITSPSSTKFIWVNVDVDRTQVNSVAPYLGVIFDQREVVIRGDNFEPGEITGVRFGGIDAPSFRIVSASEIRATPPSLGTGSHAVTLMGSVESAVSTADFSVVPPALYFTSHLPLAAPAVANAEPVAIAYDAVEERIYVAVDQPALPDTRDFLARYTYQSGGTWAAANAYESYDSLRAMTLALDGKSLLISEDEFTFDVQGFLLPGIAVTNWRFDEGRFSSLHYDGWSTNFIKSIAVANDGRAVMVSAADAGGNRPAFGYMSLTPYLDGDDWPLTSLERLTPQGAAQSSVFDNGVAGATGDGSRVLIASSAAPSDLYEYDAATSTLRRTDQRVRASAVQLDRTGSRILLNNTDVYDGNFQLLGQLPGDTVAAVFSPTVSHIYAYNSSGQLSSFDVSGTSVTPIATWSPGTSAGDPQRRIVMTITPEGWTLLIAGTAGVLVEHIPDHAR